MPTVDEIALASEEEVETHLRQLLQPGEGFTIGLDEGVWEAKIFRGESLIWDKIGYDRKILLLDAYGHLWKRVAPPVSPLWQRRREITREDVSNKAQSLSIPDPEDLNPSEIRSVYEAHVHLKKKV